MDWKRLWDESGLKLREAADATGFKESTINGLILREEGSARLKKAVRALLEQRLHVADSVNQTLQDGTPIEYDPEYQPGLFLTDLLKKHLKSSYNEWVNAETPIAKKRKLLGEIAEIAIELQKRIPRTDGLTPSAKSKPTQA